METKKKNKEKKKKRTMFCVDKCMAKFKIFILRPSFCSSSRQNHLSDNFHLLN